MFLQVALKREFTAPLAYERSYGTTLIVVPAPLSLALLFTTTTTTKKKKKQKQKELLEHVGVDRSVVVFHFDTMKKTVQHIAHAPTETYVCQLPFVVCAILDALAVF